MVGMEWLVGYHAYDLIGRRWRNVAAGARRCKQQKLIDEVTLLIGGQHEAAQFHAGIGGCNGMSIDAAQLVKTDALCCRLGAQDAGSKGETKGKRYSSSSVGTFRHGCM